MAIFLKIREIYDYTKKFKFIIRENMFETNEFFKKIYEEIEVFIEIMKTVDIDISSKNPKRKHYGGKKN